MQPKNWIKVKEILRETLDVEQSRRRSFLEKAEISTEVRAEVESLLAFEEASEDFMSLSISDFSKDFTESDVLLAGQRIGIYEIVREIGYGGMGAVYLAERADGKFQQHVALKILKREMNTAALRRRFQQEREILASLQHPNIARLLDAGMTDDKIPFLVMEYVEGVPVTEFCRENDLDLIARLKLFNRICDAAAFAHRNLIVHRDLKPSNIIVQPDGTPKLLDFGISKLLGETGEKTATLFGAMTPQYASPEQIKGESVTTATDIYSLGVVLYKMLTGTFPYDFTKKLNGDVFRTITETEPRKPSAVLSSKFQVPSSKFEDEISENKGQKANPKSKIQNLKLLRGDVDNILLKSLSKEPERRYETVEQFAADIWRFIDGLPILARPATFSYRAGKFFNRNKIPVIAAALIFLSLLTGIILAARQTAVAREQAALAEQQAAIAVESKLLAENETDKAKREQEKAEKISKFMAKVISYANPAWYAEGAKFGGDARVIDALDDLSDKIDAEFEGEPDVAAELHHKFTEVYNIVRVREQNPARREQFAEKQKFNAVRALELRRQYYGDFHELVAKDMFYACGNEKDYAHQAAMLARAIEMMRQTNPNNLNLPYMLEAYVGRIMSPDYSELHDAYRNAVIPPTDENAYQISERYLREALPIFRFHYKEDNYAIFSNECNLAYALAMQNKQADFDEHFAICKQGATKIQTGFSGESLKPTIELIEKALAERNISK